MNKQTLQVSWFWLCGALSIGLSVEPVMLSVQEGLVHGWEGLVYDLNAETAILSVGNPG